MFYFNAILSNVYGKNLLPYEVIQNFVINIIFTTCHHYLSDQIIFIDVRKVSLHNIMTSNRKLVLLSRHKCYKTKQAQHIIIPEILCTWSPDLVLALPFILRAFCMQAVWPTQRWPFFTLFLPYFQFLDTKIQINKLLTITFRKYIHYIAHLATQHQKRGDFRKTPLASSLTDV